MDTHTVADAVGFCAAFHISSRPATFGVVGLSAAPDELFRSGNQEW